jgi:hypothetical protein
MNLSLRKEKSHKRTESTSSAQVLKKTQPEEFDLVILGGGTGSTVAKPQAIKLSLIGVCLSFRGQLDEICPHPVSDLHAL